METILNLGWLLKHKNLGVFWLVKSYKKKCKGSTEWIVKAKHNTEESSWK